MRDLDFGMVHFNEKELNCYEKKTPGWPSSSSLRPFSISWWRAYRWAVVLHTQHRSQGDTILCPYLINCATLYLLLFLQLRESSVLIPHCHSSSPYLSASAATVAVSLPPYRSSPACSHHLILTCYPQLLSAVSHRSRIGRVAIYCTTVFCLLQM